MSDKPLEPGDMALVIKCPHCNGIDIGRPIKVSFICETTADCPVCGYEVRGLCAIQEKEGGSGRYIGYPVSWLKRIPPPEELNLDAGFYEEHQFDPAKLPGVLREAGLL
jgi:predicted RNA-binding Zn-ribbon protein involved in translation (DUF1610 family)